MKKNIQIIFVRSPRSIVGILLLALLLAGSMTQVARAIDEEFYSGNDIFFYDPTCSKPGGSQAITSGPAATSLKDFVDKYGQIAFDTGKKYGIPYEAILAQGALESGMGGSGLTQKANNFFGIKAGSSWTGPTINMQTGEQTAGGGSYTTNAAFRVYATPQDGWNGYGEFITGNPRYKDALRYPGDPIAYLTAIKAAGYATDVNYVAKTGGLAISIAKYIAETGKWPPSSEVAKTNTPAGSTSPAALTTPGGCATAAGNGSSSVIVQTALLLAWPNRGKHNGTAKSLAKTEYQTAMPQFNNYENAGSTPWTDCGVFVATVMRMSGADPQYVGRGTDSQLNYVQKNNKFLAFIPKDTAELKPGDVMVLRGHTYMYTGPYTGDDGKTTYTIAQASLGDHPPEAGNVFLSDSRGPYTAARIK